jgi:hypothetical protein
MKRAGFDVGNNPAHDVNIFPEEFLKHVVYAHLDFDAINDDEKTRPHQLALGVTEYWSNVEYLHRLSSSIIQPPKEIFLYAQTTGGRVLATRMLSNVRLRAASVSYSKMPGSDKELLIHRLVFNCFLRAIEFPIVGK